MNKEIMYITERHAQEDPHIPGANDFKFFTEIRYKAPYQEERLASDEDINLFIDRLQYIMREGSEERVVVTRGRTHYDDLIGSTFEIVTEIFYRSRDGRERQATQEEYKKYLEELKESQK